MKVGPMYLKKLHINGFKSFAEPADLSFDPGVTAIVGPNGSGKSNIIDAIRFVLGEQSTKSMRSRRMDDIIFSGNAAKKAKGAAEVVLTLSRDEEPDIEIARKLFRTGDSAYLMNGKNVRLRDIQEMFLDTGLGKNGYSIVSQGGVDNIINAGPQELRSIVEEAAGIASFKVRRTETERRLKSTRENIERIRDILQEIKKQLLPMEKQAVKTKRYQELYERLKAIELILFYNEESLSVKELQAAEKQLSELRFQVFDAEKRSAEQDKIYSSLKDRIEEASTTEANLVKQLSETKEALTEADKNEALSLNSAGFARRSLHSLTEETTHRADKEKELASQKQQLDLELTGLQKRVNDNHALIKAHEAQIDELTKKLAEHLDEKQRASENRRQAAFQAEEFRKTLLSQRTRLAQIQAAAESDISKTDELKNQLRERQAACAKLDRQTKEAETAYTQQTAACNLLREKVLNLREESRKLSEKLHQDKARLNMLENQKHYQEDLKRSYSGYHAAVKAVMKKNLSGVFGPMAELMSIPEAYTQAVQAALGARAQNVVVDTEDTARLCIDTLKREKAGRATFLPLDALHYRAVREDELVRFEQQPGFVGLASSVCVVSDRIRPAAESLLGRTVILKDFSSAAAFRRRFPGYTAVTTAGELFYPGGAVVGGSTGKETRSVLFRTAELDRIRAEYTKVSEALRASVEQYKRIAAQIDETDSRLKQETAEAAAVQKKLFEVQGRLDSERNQLEKDKLNFEQIRLSADGMSYECTQLQQQIASTEQSLEALTSTTMPVYDDAQENALREKLAALRSEKNGFEITRAGFEERLRTLTQSIAEKQEQQRLLADEALQMQEKKRAFLQEIEESETQKNSWKEKIVLLKSQIGVLEKQLTDASGTVARLSSERSVCEEKIKQFGRSHLLSSEAKSKAEQAAQRIRLSTKNRQDRIFDKYGVNFYMLEDDIQTLKSKVPEPTEEERRSLNSEISRLGPVNPDALTEYQTLLERNDALQAQYDDLLKAEADILEVIQELNTSMETRFAERFERLNIQFAKVFSLLFEGGHASLHYTEPESVLTSGVELTVSPPGKNPRHIALLSGGEKALTAIALLFSFIALNPAPFCIIDEIDAALDDSNIYRFTHYIEQIAASNQFIIVTHRKSTLRICEKIHGVSMAGNGISKLISVELSDYIEDGSSQTGAAPKPVRSA